jgi:quercetin dioxygenase-like cupin family protein
MTVTTDRPYAAVLSVPDQMRLDWHRLPESDGVMAKILSAGGGEVAGLLSVEPDGGIEPHVHESGGHHMYVLEGRCWFGGELLVEGAYVRVPAGVTHSLQGGGPSGCRLLYVASGGALDDPDAAVP